MQRFGQSLSCLWALSAMGLYAQTVVEYVNKTDFPRSPGGQYFYSADPAEQASVDAGGAGAFKRTGNAFRAGGATPLCRFYGSVSPGPNSHFYTVDAGECSALRSAQVSPKPTTAQQWNYEGNGFSGSAPLVDSSGNKACPMGTVPVYRAYNNAFKDGVKNTWDSNHRYSTNKGDIDFLVATQTWKSEGLSFCAQGMVSPSTLPPADSKAGVCAAPRSDPKLGDKPGTLDDEKTWVRSYVDERYLWYREVPAVAASDYANPQAYFRPLKSHETTKSGKPKDEFHFWADTAAYEASERGEAGVGYGFDVAPKTDTRRATIAIVQPASPAGLAGLRRGMQVIAVNGVPDSNLSFAGLLQIALQPTAAGARNRFLVKEPDTNVEKEYTLSAAAVTESPVMSLKTLDTPSGKVGYMLFNDFNLPAELSLAQSFATLSAAGVKDLVLDLRYNGGGYIYIASQLSYMIAGTNAAGKTFNRSRYNDKRTQEENDPDNIDPFYNVESGFTDTNTVAGRRLPSLNLKRLFVLVSNGSASASELVINALRGVDIEVVLIGETTRGKPFGFVPEDNCGTTYFTVEFQAANAKGFGDYADGFEPTCRVAEDDVTHDFGDPRETRLATALAYRDTGKCPAGTNANETVKRIVNPNGVEFNRSGMFGLIQSPHIRNAMQAAQAEANAVR